MKPKTLIVLIAALVACVAFIVLRHSYQTLIGEGQGARSEAGLFESVPLGARELTVLSAEGDKLSFVKVDGVWRMAEPVEAKADRMQVEALADALISPQVTPVAGNDAAESVTGLGRPGWTISVTDQRGRIYRLAVGREAVMTGGQRTYVRDEDSKHVFVASFDFPTRLSQPVSDWRDRSLWEFDQADVRRVAVTGRDSYELIRSGDGWEVAARRFRAAGDAGTVQLLLDRLTYLTISSFVTDSPEGLTVYGLDNPRLTVTVELTQPAVPQPEPGPEAAPATHPTSAEAGRTYTLALGAPVGEKVYAKLAGIATVFELPASLLEDLQPALADLRDRHVLAVEPAAVRGVDLELPAGRTVLVAQDDHWQMELPFPGPANWAAVSIFLERVQSLRAEDFIDEAAAPAAYGLERPRGTITLHLAEGTPPAQLLIGNQSPSGDMTFVQSAEQPFVAVVRTADAEALLQGAAEYWDTTLLKLLPTERASTLEIHRDKERIALTADDSGHWQMSKPVSAPADTAAVTGLLAALRELRAQRIVSLDRTVPKNYAKADGLISVELTTTVPPSEPSTPSEQPEQAAPEAETTTYRLHAVKQEGSVYAWLEGQTPAAVGLVGSSLLDKLTAEFRSRQVGLATKAEAELVKITLEGNECVLQHLLGQWRCHADPHLIISPVKVDAFVQNVRLLKAQRFVSYSPGAEKQKEFGLKQPYLAVEITSTAGQTYRVAVSQTGPEGSAARYACSSSVDGVFLLSGPSILGLSKKLDDFKD